MQIKKGVKGNLLRTLNIGGLKMQNLIIYQNSVIAPVAKTVLSGCSVKGWLLGSSPRHPQRREYRFSGKPFEPSLINKND